MSYRDLPADEILRLHSAERWPLQRIAERSAVVHQGQRWLKRAFMEMGGKDAMIVDETADLEQALGRL